MKPPQRITVLGHSIEVRSSGAENLEPETLGDAQPDYGLIRIRSGIPEDLQRSVLLHEVIHTSIAIGGHGHKFKDEEHFIEVLTPILLHTLRENPALARYLLTNDDGAADTPRRRALRHRRVADEGADRGLSRVSALPSKGPS